MASNIISDLANATKALTAHRFGVTTAGNNLANVNNPDYARQRVVLGEEGMVQTLYGPQGLGVEVQGFAHMRDVILDREVLRETSIKGSLEAQEAALSKAEANVGQRINRTGDSAFIDGGSDTGGTGGIAETLNDFFNAFHSLSANPSSDAEKESLIQKADILVQKFNVAAERFDDLRSDLTLQVQTDLAESNRILEEVARLNAEIARAEANHAGQALSLRDQRQALLEDLSERMQIKTEEIPDSNGQIRVYVPAETGSKPQFDLVERGRFNKIEFEDDGVLPPRFVIANKDVQIAVRGGSIHGALQARDGAIETYARSLDDLASTLVDQVNDLYNPDGTLSNFFANTGTARGISLESSLDSSTLRASNDGAAGAGDNKLALAIAELAESEVAPGGRTMSSFYRSVVTDLGEGTSKVQSQLRDEEIVFQLLKEQQDSVSGVSIDEEMTDMMKFQRAFQATSKLINVIDEMLDVIVNRLI